MGIIELDGGFFLRWEIIGLHRMRPQEIGESILWDSRDLH